MVHWVFILVGFAFGFFFGFCSLIILQRPPIDKEALMRGKHNTDKS